MPGSPKVQVVLAPSVHCRLKVRAAMEGRSISNLAAYLLERGLYHEKGSKAVSTSDG